MNKPQFETPDFTQQNIDKIAALFPGCVTEMRGGGGVDGKVKRGINFEMLKQMLSPDVVDGDECYEFTWVGKKASIVEANKPIRKTLRPCPEESKDWDTTENLYIEGDNLEVLKLLQEAYLGKVKMIYIDPPYNTGSDFIYADDFMRTQKEENEQMGMYDEDENRLFKNTDTNGRFHSDWCSMMYSRLLLSRNLLTEDGAIFISIDENEVNTLKAICDEIFGASNFIAELIWSAGRKNDSKYISVSHEYILCYFKSAQYIKDHKILWREKKQGLADIYVEYDRLKKIYGSDYTSIEKGLKGWYKALPDGHPAKDHSHYCRVDENGIFFADNISWPGGGGPKYQVLHPLTHKPVKIPSRGWLTNESTMKQWIAQGRVEFGKDENAVPTLKSYLKDREYSVPYSVFYKDGRAASKRLATLMGDKVFENPKDEEIIQRIIQFCGTDDGDIIMDFFSGSATTAHALFLANEEQNKHRKFILVQLPEPIDPQKEASEKARKVAQNAVKLLDSLGVPHTICEIGKERIRRAGAQILERSLESLERDGMIEKIDKSKLPVLSSKNSPVENLEKEGVIEKLSTSQLSALSSKNSLGKEGVIEKYAGELSEIRSLEEVYGSGGARVSSHQAAAAGGDLRTGRSDASGGSFHSVEYSGGTVAGNAGVYPVFESGKGITGGVGNTVIALRSLALLNELGYRVCLERFRGDQQNACGTDQTSELQTLNSKLQALNSKLQALNSKLSLDIGFRVLKLDDSNMKDVYYAADEYEQGNLMDMISNIKEDRTDLDLLFGCLLDWGLPLSLPYTSEQIDGCTVHTYNDGDLIACFDANIPESVVKEIASRKPLRAVFRDSSFANSPAKINVFEIFKLYMPEDADDISKRVRVI